VGAIGDVVHPNIKKVQSEILKKYLRHLTRKIRQVYVSENGLRLSEVAMDPPFGYRSH
jgi:predicted RNA methylase